MMQQGSFDPSNLQIRLQTLGYSFISNKNDCFVLLHEYVNTVCISCSVANCNTTGRKHLCNAMRIVRTIKGTGSVCVSLCASDLLNSCKQCKSRYVIGCTQWNIRVNDFL